MSESISEVRALLAGAAESLGTAYQHARVARDRLDDALGVLVDLDGQHAESLVPPQLRKACDELDRGLTMIGGGRDAVADLDARL